MEKEALDRSTTRGLERKSTEGLDAGDYNDKTLFRSELNSVVSSIMSRKNNKGSGLGGRSVSFEPGGV